MFQLKRIIGLTDSKDKRESGVIHTYDAFKGFGFIRRVKGKDVFFFYDQFLFVSILIFLIGMYDDKYELKANLKLIFLCISIITFININSDLIIESVNFYTFNKTINLSSYSNFFTILCVLLFMNAFNMMDGTNLLAGTYTLIFSYNPIFIINM